MLYIKLCSIFGLWQRNFCFSTVFQCQMLKVIWTFPGPNAWLWNPQILRCNIQFLLYTFLTSQDSNHLEPWIKSFCLSFLHCWLNNMSIGVVKTEYGTQQNIYNNCFTPSFLKNVLNQNSNIIQYSCSTFKIWTPLYQIRHWLNHTIHRSFSNNFSVSQLHKTHFLCELYLLLLLKVKPS